jgi:hypothetical protein
MSRKGIWALAACLLAAVPAGALEERLTLAPGAGPGPAAGSRTLGGWTSDGAALRPGYKGSLDYVIADAAYGPGPGVDLLVHMDSGKPADEAGGWTIEAGRSFSVDTARSAFGSGSGSFRGEGSALSIAPGPGSLLAARSSFRDFTVEFWLYPANVENGEVVLLWQSVRALAGGASTQRISCVVASGRLAWSFSGFFCAPDGPASVPVELRARSPLVPRAWSHHLVRFDGDTGLVEYLVDGVPEAAAHATASGREGGAVYEPAVGAAAPLRLCPGYSGLADELRISRSFVEEPALLRFGRDAALVISPVADLGYGNSRLVAVEAEAKAPGASGIELSYRIADSWAGWRPDSPAWTPLRPGEALPDSARGRFAQVKAELFPDGSGRLTPALSSLTLRFEPDPPPPPPARLAAIPKDGAVELRWTRVPEADLAGYLVYYGDRPGEYGGTGTDQGPSPVDAGNSTSMTITGIPNGRLLYFAVAAYDGAPAVSAVGAAASSPARRAASRAGEFSPEASARPSRTADR